MLKVWIWLLAILTIFVMACAPSVTPASPTVAPSPVQATKSALASPEDVAWAKVVEAAKGEGVLVIYSATLVGETGVVVAKAFRDKYGVKADIMGGTSPVMIERVKTEYRAGQYIADLTTFSTGRAIVLKRDGITISNKDLPVLRDRTPWNTHPFDLDPEGYLLAFYLSDSGPWVNTNLVRTEDEPKSWQDLLDAKWKGKLVAGDPGVYIGTTQSYYAMVIKSGRLTEDYFRQLRAQIKKFVAGGASEQGQTVARGEGHINLTTSSAAGGARLVAEGAPIKALQLKEGTSASPAEVWAQLSKAQHPNATRLFLNWFLSVEGIRVWAEAAAQSTNRKDVPDFRFPAARTNPATTVVVNYEDYAKIENMYSEGFMTKLWKGEAGK